MIKSAMILAAGRGKRMRPLTDSCPKPLLKIAGKALIQYHLEALAEANFTKVVINHAWLGEQIQEVGEPKLTFSGVRVYHPQLFDNGPSGRFSLPVVLRRAMAKELVSGEHFAGHWYDIGQPGRLTELEQKILSGEIV